MRIFPYGTTEIEYLRNRDHLLGEAISEIGMIERQVIPDLFTAIVSSIASQQISAKAAATVWKRIEDRFGTITPETICRSSPAEIQRCGMSMRKAGYIYGIAEAVMNGDLDLVSLARLPDEEVVARLSALNGIGVWTAEMLLIFAMERPDVVSWGDAAIRRGMMKLYHTENLDRKTFLRVRSRYSPFGSVASLYLWEIAHR